MVDNKVDIGAIARATGNYAQPGTGKNAELHLFPSAAPGLSALGIASAIGVAVGVGALTTFELTTAGLATAAVVTGGFVLYEVVTSQNGKAQITAPDGTVLTFTETRRDPIFRNELETKKRTVLPGSTVTIEANDGKDHLLRGFTVKTATTGEQLQAVWNNDGWWISIAGAVGLTLFGVIAIDRAKKSSRVVRGKKDEKIVVIGAEPAKAGSGVPGAVASVIGKTVEAGGKVSVAAEEAESRKKTPPPAPTVVVNNPPAAPAMRRRNPPPPSPPPTNIPEITIEQQIKNLDKGPTQAELEAGKIPDPREKALDLIDEIEKRPTSESFTVAHKKKLLAEAKKELGEL